MFLNLCEMNDLLNLCVFFWGVDFEIWETFLSSHFPTARLIYLEVFVAMGFQSSAEHRAVQKEDFRDTLPGFKTWLYPPASCGPLGSHHLTDLYCKARLITGPTL